MTLHCGLARSDTNSTNVKSKIQSEGSRACSMSSGRLASRNANKSTSPKHNTHWRLQSRLSGGALLCLVPRVIAEYEKSLRVPPMGIARHPSSHWLARSLSDILLQSHFFGPNVKQFPLIVTSLVSRKELMAHTVAFCSLAGFCFCLNLHCAILPQVPSTCHAFLLASATGT